MGDIVAAYMVPHPPIIIPQIGKEAAARVEKTVRAMEKMAREVAEKNPTTILVTSPHAPAFEDYFYLPDDQRLEGDFARFGAADLSYRLENNLLLARSLDRACRQANFYGGFLSEGDKDLHRISRKLDHGVLVPWYFLDQEKKDQTILYLPLAQQSIDKMMAYGRIIRQVIMDSDERVAFIASGDLSHALSNQAPAGFDPRGLAYDKKLLSIIRDMDREALLSISQREMAEAAECGTRSFSVLWGALGQGSLKSDIYSYEKPFGVGYMVARLEKN